MGDGWQAPHSPLSFNPMSMSMCVRERFLFTNNSLFHVCDLEANKKSAHTVTWARELVNYQPEPESEPYVYVAEKVVEGVEMSFASLDASRAGAA